MINKLDQVDILLYTGSWSVANKYLDKCIWFEHLKTISPVQNKKPHFIKKYDFLFYCGLFYFTSPLQSEIRLSLWPLKVLLNSLQTKIDYLLLHWKLLVNHFYAKSHILNIYIIYFINKISSYSSWILIEFKINVNLQFCLSLVEIQLFIIYCFYLYYLLNCCFLKRNKI